MTKVDSVVSSIPSIIVTTNDFCNDGIPSDPLLSSGTYIDVVLDVRVENTTPNKGDITNGGNVFDVTPSNLQIQRKITPMRLVNLDRSKWFPKNWRSKNEVDYFLKAGSKLKKAENNINCDPATPSEEKNRIRAA
uniref:Uncharacterized protein n=1 Tax=Solanum tuberosum TaxID=4113 RepID=M1CYQ8_SOLTU